jgi:hypothetical protein
VYIRDEAGWTQQQKLVPDDGANGDNFGGAVAISGDTILVSGGGAVYVFERVGTQWTQEDKLQAGAGSFGISVAISGDTALVGAPIQDDDGGNTTGAAYVFKRLGGVWIQDRLLASDGAEGDRFGNVVALSGNTALIAAAGCCNPGFGFGDSGAVYAFERTNGLWNEQDKLIGDDSAADDAFGFSMDVEGDMAIIGAPQDRTGGLFFGSAYVFERDGTDWTQTDKLIPSDVVNGNGIGVSVSMWRNFATIGNANDAELGAAAGSVYLYQRIGKHWKQQDEFFAADGMSGDNLGFSASISDGAIVVGAAENDELADNAGSAYVISVEDRHLLAIPDINDNGSSDLAIVWGDGTYARMELRDGLSGEFIRRMVYTGVWDINVIAAAVLNDADGDGKVEIAVLGERQSDGRVFVEINNVLTASNAQLVWFAPNHYAVDLAVIAEDADNNGVPELAVLSQRNSDGRMLVEVKNAFGPTNPNSVWFMPGNTPIDLEVVPDKDGNGVPEIAVLSSRDSDGRIVAEIKNASGLTNPSAVWFMPGNTAIDLAVVGDKDMNGIPEVAVLSSRDSDGRNVVEVKNASGATLPSAVWFAAGHTADQVGALNDADSNGVPEVAVLSTRDSDGRILVEVKNAAGATNPHAIWYSPGFTASGFAVREDNDGNLIEELAVLMYRNSDLRILVQSRNAAGTLIPTDYWFSP